ncbi:Uncharacterized protein APZ42_021150 [Daphnia magna]|uniref:Uncharacterized protein n=1 Tax=Daphnia magna TaxID=35525 RepID=A0A164X1E2_9CRUS|nr:Uncharacterized protein APZ42_021150 [Daphnia magna]
MLSCERRSMAWLHQHVFHLR